MATFTEAGRLTISAERRHQMQLCAEAQQRVRDARSALMVIEALPFTYSHQDGEAAYRLLRQAEADYQAAVLILESM